MGTIVVDRIIDLLSLLFAIILALVLQGDVLYAFFRDKLANTIFAESWLYILLAGLILLLFLLYKFRRWIKRWSLYQKIQHLVEGFRDGLRSLKQVKQPWVLFLDTVIIWLMYYLMMFLCFNSFPPTAHLGMMAGLMTFVFGGLGIVFPSPGGMGTFHAMVIMALAIYGIAGDDAFSFANIQYFSVQLFGCMLTGIIGLIALPIINKKINPMSKPRRPAQQKIYDVPSLLKQLEKWHSQGDEIVFTNGCFDILHAGHIAYLEAAANLGEKLIVGVNDDASVQRLKGETRPINVLASRLFYWHP